MTLIGVEVDWFYAPDLLRDTPRKAGSGRVIGYCDAPQVYIETEEGRRVWWRADLTRPASKPKGASW